MPVFGDTYATFIRFLAGVMLGVVLFLIGGVTWQPPVPKCPGCAVLNAHYASYCAHPEAVVGGVICG